MSEAGGDIIIKGGSVQVVFDGTLYQRNSSDPSSHSHSDRKIMRIRVMDETGVTEYDSGVHPDGLRWTIVVSTR